MIFINVRQPNLLIHLRPIIAILQKNEADLTIIYNNDNVRTKIESEFSKLCFVEEQNIDHVQEKGITISADVHSKAPPNSFHLNTLHNQPVKYWLHPTNLLQNFDGFLCWGPFQKEFILHLYRQGGLIAPEIFESGAPLLDSLVYPHKNRADLEMQYGIKRQTKTVLYAPSWNKGLSLDKFGKDIIDAFKNCPKDINILLRLHPASLFSKEHDPNGYFTGNQAWLDFFKSHLADKENIFDLSGDPNAINAILLSDCVLTDFSSIAWDAMVTDVDLFHLDCPEWPTYAAQNKNFGLPKEVLTLQHDFLNAGRRYGNGVIAPEQISELLRAYSDGQKLPARQASVVRLHSRLLYNPGCAAQKTFEIVTQLHNKIFGY